MAPSAPSRQRSSAPPPPEALLTLLLLWAAAHASEPLEIPAAFAVGHARVGLVSAAPAGRPEGADEQLAETCRVRVFMSAEGVPTGADTHAPVTVEGCDPRFADAAGLAAQAWRIDPVWSLRREERIQIEAEVSWAAGRVGSDVTPLPKVAPVVELALLVVRRQVEPEPPDVPLSQPVRCLAQVEIGRAGRPRDVVVEQCPEAFRVVTERALRRWRWEPPEVRGARVTARCVVGVTFEREPGSAR